ncbi:carboxyl transferase domain-containing protein [Micropruina sp.]|uniref:carboxyl transferase domain-containing protein n=1 Tax=Micropruina sp. TaxID=2737536 RepID=UPI0039E7250A
MARALNAASGNRPVVVLANLSGFDGSPESMRNLQLEYGAEIGRAVVNFDGPIVFVVISRYHGGAFVVFSKTLNENMTVLALEGSFASVIGGAPRPRWCSPVTSRSAPRPTLECATSRRGCARPGRWSVRACRLNS